MSMCRSKVCFCLTPTHQDDWFDGIEIFWRSISGNQNWHLLLRRYLHVFWYHYAIFSIKSSNSLRTYTYMNLLGLFAVVKKSVSSASRAVWQPPIGTIMSEVNTHNKRLALIHWSEKHRPWENIDTKKDLEVKVYDWMSFIIHHAKHSRKIFRYRKINCKWFASVKFWLTMLS